jgi:putative tricarboxylic transport membrane protein
MPLLSLLKRTKKGMADRIVFFGSVLLAVVYLYATSQIPTIEMMDPLGPRAFPVLLGISLLVVAGLLLLEIRRGTVAPSSPASAQNQGYWLMIAAVSGWMALYFAAFEKLGYLIDTTAFLLGLMAYFHRGKWTANILTAVLFSGGSFFLFTKVLGVTLPKGLLTF